MDATEARIRRVWETQVTKAEKMILLALVDYGDNDTGGNAHPGVERLAADCSLSGRTIQRALRRLEGRGYIVVERPASPRHHHATTYRVVLPPGDTMSPPGDTMSPGPPLGGCHSVTLPNTSTRSSGFSTPLRSASKKLHWSGSARKTRAARHQPRKDRYAREFAASIRTVYPKRFGDQKWATAESYFRAERKRGTELGLLVEATRQYADYCRVTGILGTERVKMASSFFGRDRCWEHNWRERPPTPRPLAADAAGGSGPPPVPRPVDPRIVRYHEQLAREREANRQEELRFAAEIRERRQQERTHGIR